MSTLTKQGKALGGRLWRILAYVLLIGIALYAVGPYYWMLKTSLETATSLYQFPPSMVPYPVTLKNYQTVWENFNLGRFFLNSAIITGAGVLLSVLLAALFAYPLARFQFPGRKLIFFLVLIPMMVPLQGTFIINFLTTRALGMVNTYAGVVIPNAVSLFGIFLLRQAYLGIPRDFEDAAAIDGASEFYIWWRIMLPMVKPSLATLALFQFLGYWNNFLWPLVVLQDPEMYPLSVGLLYLNNSFQTNFRNVAAGAVIATIPVILLLAFLQRYMVKGLTAGGVKY